VHDMGRVRDIVENVESDASGIGRVHDRDCDRLM
jgi:hypothetical protein